MTGRQIYDRFKVDAAIKELVGTKAQVYLACTEAGAGAVDLLWQTPGISSTLVGSEFPYRNSAFDAFVGRRWKDTGFSYCGPEAALAMAQSAYFRCQSACNDPDHLGLPIIGVGLTAAASTTRTLRGGTRIYAAARTDNSMIVFYTTLEQGLLGREGDGQVCDLVALNMAINGAYGAVVPFARTDLGLDADLISGVSMVMKNPPREVIDPKELDDGIYIDENGVITALSDVEFHDKIVYPGSYRPMHFGHDTAALRVMQETGRTVVFEITVDHAHKEATIADVVARAWQFRGRWPVILRKGGGLFVDKASDYPGAHFLCGMDVAEKVLDKKYYGNSNRMLNAALLDMLERDVKFYIIDRRAADGTLKTRKDLAVPADYESMFGQVSVHWDVSSTELRTARG